MLLRRLLPIIRVTWFVAVVIATLALFNYPRTWVQELISETALLWMPICVGGMIFQLSRFTSAPFSFIGSALFILQLMSVVRTVHVVMPYLYAAPKAYPTLTYAEPTRFLLVDISDRSWSGHPEAVSSLLDIENPSVVVALRYSDTPLVSQAAERYPFTLKSSLLADRTVEIFSKLPITSPERSEFGYGALPAVFGVVRIGEGADLQLGALDLLPAYSQDSFVKSRLTSRRLASSLRYSTDARMVVGAFRASVTSQIVDMYVDQLRLRSLFFDSGISKLRDLYEQSFDFERNLNVFSARNIEISHIVESHAADSGFSAIIFDARIPKNS